MILSITGPSGVGKTTLLHNLLKRLPSAHPLESITTRPPRPSDEPGEYRYVSIEEFETLQSEGVFLWSAQADTNRYGTRTEVINQALSNDVYIPILVIRVLPILYAHAATVAHGEMLRSVYIHIDDAAELRRRLQERGDSPDSIVRRIEECRTWYRDAQDSGIPFLFLDGKESRENLLAQTLAYIQH